MPSLIVLLAAPSVLALTSSEVGVSRVTSFSAQINWLTDEPSNGRVRFGTTTSLGLSAIHQEQRTNHSIVLTGLDTDTLYFFEVVSQMNGAEAVDDNNGLKYSFRTLDIIAPPKVANVRASSKTVNSITLTWDVPGANDLHHYDVYQTGVLIGNVSAAMPLLFNHSSLVPGQSHPYKVRAVDTSGNEGPLSDELTISTTREDTTAPVISNVEYQNATDTQITLAFTTDENAAAEIRYGETTLATVEKNDALLTAHALKLTNLRKNATYSYLLISCDVSGNCANTSSKFSAGKDVVPPFINVTLPRFINKVVADIIGSTEPFSEISLFVNNLNLPLRVLGSSETGGQGRIALKGITLRKDNLIKITARDKAGNANQQLFEVSVDVEDPVVAFRGIPNVTSLKNLTIAGSVNEQVIIRVFVRPLTKEKETQPGAVTGFRNASIGENFVTLAWNKAGDNDFSHYILRRADVGAIAVLEPATYTSYTDILVDAGKQYAYTISYMNKFGKEGNESVPLTVRLPSKGIVTGIKPVAANIIRDFSKPDKEINASGDFTMGVMLGNSEDTYEVKIEVTDLAGNRVTQISHVGLDTKIPEIKIISPPNNAMVFENYANEINIEGKTEPGARVHLFVGRTPFNDQNLSFDISGLKKEMESIAENSLDANCNAIVRSRNICGTNADYSTTADEQGVFHFFNVDATSFFGASGSIREVPETEFSTNTVLKQSRRAKLVFIATDKAGLRNAIQNDITIGTCWSGNLSWDVIPLTEFQSPTFLSTERLTENTESIFFYFNYSYIGPGSGRTPKIKSVSLTKACGTKEVLDPRFNISCQILPEGAQAVQVNPEGTVSYSAVKLNRITGMDKWLAGDWKGIFSAINNELSFPFKVTITYQHDVEGRTLTEVQTTCQEVTYVMDNSRIDFRGLPDWLLYDGVDLINKSLSTIRMVQEQIDMIMPYVAMGCLGSYGANFGAQVWRRWVEISTGRGFTLDKQGGNKGKIAEAALSSFFPSTQGDMSGNGDYCKQLIRSFENSKEYKGFKLDYLSDADLEKCFPQVAAAWEAEATTYNAYRYTCDRVFGHTTPSGWTETKSDAALTSKIALGEACANEQSVKGQRVRREKCADAVARQSPISKPGYTLDDYCLRFKTSEGLFSTWSVYRIGEEIDSSTGLHKLELIDGSGGRDTTAIKATEDEYLLPQPKTCDELCGIRPNSKSIELKRGSETIYATPTSKKGESAVGYCTTAQQCISFNAQADKGNAGLKLTDSSSSKALDVKAAKKKGYTKDCFYGADNELSNPSVVSNDPKQRYECCCITGSVADPIQYYDSKDTYLDSSIAGGAPVHTTANVANAPTATINTEEGGHVPLEWSYRYWKIKFRAKGTDMEGTSTPIHTEYNKLRYIAGRDQPACFGQSALLDTDNSLLVLDSNRQHLSALQCANLGGIQQRLTLTSNILSALQTCLIKVRTTGTSDTGVCKEIFTQNVCSFAWDAIQMIQNGFNGCKSGMFDFDSGSDEEISSIATIAKDGLRGITSTLQDKQSEFMGEYGNAKLNELFGGGAETTARKICLAAFGYDWPFSVKNLMDASYAQPFATLVQGVTASRDYLSVDPKKRQTIYEYRSSWLINPGCDFSNYKIELACVGRDTLDAGLGADCSKQRSPDGINCPCLDSGEKVLAFFTDNRFLKQNQLVDRNFHDVITSAYRYDHFKVTLRPDPKIDKSIRSRCFPTGYDGGVFYYPITDRTARDIAACRMEPLSGVLMCDGGLDFFSTKGFAYFNAIRINGQPAEQVKELLTGQPLTVEADIFNTGSNKCLVARINKPVVRNVAQPVQMNGTSTTQLQVLDRIAIQSLPPLQISPSSSGISASLESTDSLTPINFQIMFTDDGDGKLSNGDTFTVSGIPSSPPIKLSENSESASGDGFTTATVTTAYNGQIPQILIALNGGGTKVKITGVNFLTGNKQKAAGATTSGSITIGAPVDSTSQNQQAISLNVGLFNVRETAQTSSVFNPNTDCNTNDPVTNPQLEPQTRTYTINLVKSGATGTIGGSSGAVYPVVIQPSPAGYGAPIKATVRVSRKDITSAAEKVQLFIDDAADDAPTADMQRAEQVDSLTDIYSATLTNIPSGTHTARVIVTFSSPSQNQLPLKSGTTSFKVACSPRGLCGLPTSTCAEENPADVLSPCPSQGSQQQKCCVS